MRQVIKSPQDRSHISKDGGGTVTLGILTQRENKNTAGSAFLSDAAKQSSSASSAHKDRSSAINDLYLYTSSTHAMGENCFLPV